MISGLAMSPAGQVGAPQPPGPEELRLFSEAPAGFARARAPDATIRRARIVNVNVGLLSDAQRNETLYLDLFDGVEVTAVRKEMMPTRPGGFVWIGKIPDQAESLVIFSSINGVVVGNITTNQGENYQLRYAGSGLQVVYQVDQSAFPPEAPPIPIDARGSEKEKPAATEGTASMAPLTDSGSRIDVMVVYTADARSDAGGTDAMIAEVYLGLSETNQSYLNSNITQRLSLVHVAEVSYTESGNINTDLTRLQNPSDGFMDNVPTLRNTYGADVVSLWQKNGGGYCGLGYFMNPVSSTFAPYAYSVVARSCATGYYSFGHELGHNMSAGHDWYVEAGTAPYTYIHGHVNLAGHWRTIMAYNSKCAASGFNCTRVPYWSNPAVNYLGAPTGVASGTSTACTVGNLANPNCDADNHLVLNNTAYTVANFRSSSPGRTDVWIKDTWKDTGGQPDPLTAGEDMWKNPYIWVRNAQDTTLVHAHQHQNPEFGQTNYVYAKVQNGGSSTVSGHLEFYWANASAGLSWTANWHLISSVAANLAANADTIVEVAWSPPGTGHYCLLARWTSTGDTPFGEGVDINANTRKNNNIAWRNVNIVDLVSPDQLTQTVSFIVRAQLGRPTSFFDLVFRTPVDWQGAPFPRQGGEVLVDIGPQLLALWQEGGGQSTGVERIGDTLFRVVDPKVAALQHIYLPQPNPDRPDEGFPVLVTFEAFRPPNPNTLAEYRYEVVEKDSSNPELDPIGGVSYELNVGDRVVQSGHPGDLGDAPDSTNHFNNAPMTAYPAVPARYPTVYRNTPAGATPGPMHWDPTKQAWLGTRVSAPSWTRISRRTRTWRPTSIRPSMRPIAIASTTA